MQDPILRTATASEALSLEAEYSNCRSWRAARDKLTFIICKPIDRSFDGTGDLPFIRMGKLDRMDQMLGDVNFFLHPFDEEGGEEGWLVGEVDIMIAEPEARRQGKGLNAVQALLVYVSVQMGFILEEYVMSDKEGLSGASLKGFFAKINKDNEGSKRLFQKLGFKQHGEVNYFGEIKLTIGIDEIQQQPWWNTVMADWGQVPYGGMADELKFT